LWGLTKLCLAGIFATGCSPANRPAVDLVLSVGEIVTLDSTTASPAAVAIGNGRIVAVGDASLVSESGPGTAVVRVDGAVVAPALIDHHVHLFNVGLALLNDRIQGPVLLDLGGVKRRGGPTDQGSDKDGSAWGVGRVTWVAERLRDRFP
jgi:cytosine/adenosine deaminase-related metal-dependent hydrolase